MGIHLYSTYYSALRKGSSIYIKLSRLVKRIEVHTNNSYGGALDFEVILSSGVKPVAYNVRRYSCPVLEQIARGDCERSICPQYGLFWAICPLPIIKYIHTSVETFKLGLDVRWQPLFQEASL